MAMPALSDVTTIEQLRALPDDGLRHELLDGVHVVTPSPALPHQAVLRELMRHLLHAVGDHRQLEIFSSPADLVLGSRTLVQPDLFLVRVDPTRPPVTWTDVGVPVLAIEILSPGTAGRDRSAKRRLYQGAGVGEYWIVDTDARVVERWTPDDTRPEIVEGPMTWRAGEVSGTLDLSAMFDRAFGAG